MDPFKFLALFLSDHLLQKIVEKTNRYVEQKVILGITNEALKDSSRIDELKDVDVLELKIFFGLVLWFGLHRKPTIRAYWSQNALYKNEVSRIMLRNRFELILANLQICDNETADKSDKMYKI